MSLRSVAFLVQRIGPYHHARLEAWASQAQSCVTVIEFRSKETVYAWKPVTATGSYGRCATRLAGELSAALDRVMPKAIVCVGYGDPEIHVAVNWATRRSIPLITCSDSTYDDEPRNWLKETFKRKVVDLFDAGLVSGQRAHSYLASLGMPGRFRFQPWDVVDNAYFSEHADRAREAGSARPTTFGPRSPYYLCVARFVEKKNLGALLAAYARYYSTARSGAWPLVLSGSGPLESVLKAYVSNNGLTQNVHFPGFLDYTELPAYYAGAGALILPSLSDQWGLVVNEAMAAGLPVLVSRHCGCASDLVLHGENGFVFDPRNENAQAELLLQFSRLHGSERQRMGMRSRSVIAEFSPEAFARGIENAISAAISRRRRSVPLISRLLVQNLARRVL